MNRLTKFKTGSKGFTLLEVTVASAIAVLIMSSVVAVLSISGRTINDIYAPTKARSIRTNALNQIHFRLCDARIGSCTVTDSKHRIQFRDPNLIQNGNIPTSEFYFNLDERILYYDDDINDNNDAQVVADGPIDITFTLGSKNLDVPDHQNYVGTEAVVTVMVKTAEELSYADVDERDGEVAVYLRNI